MNILIVCEPGVDGVFRHIEGLCHFLLQRQQTVHLAYSSVRGSAALVSLVETVQQAGGRTLDLQIASNPSLKDIEAFRKLLRLTRDVKPDVIHSHSSKAGILGRALALTSTKVGYYYTPHAYYGMGARTGLRSLFYNFLETLFGRIGFTINISPDELQFATKKLRIRKDRINVIHNPVDTVEFRPAPNTEKRNLRENFGMPQDALVLGTVGRLSFQKDPQTMYRALALVMKSHPQLSFCHVGRGELEEELSALAGALGISEKVIRIPYLDAPAEIYRALDAFIITSRYEAGWPIVLLEALASNLPVIVSKCPGTSNIDGAGLSHCWTAPAEDEATFAASIASWIKDIDCQRPCNHRVFAEQHFAREVLFGRVLALYERSSSNSSARQSRPEAV